MNDKKSHSFPLPPLPLTPTPDATFVGYGNAGMSRCWALTTHTAVSKVRVAQGCGGWLVSW